MKILFAQGNPESRYARTRHNVGFQILNRYAETHGGTFIATKKFSADIAEISHAGEKVLLVKPLTYYNETGRSARALVDFYKCDPSTDFLAIHDELALPLGTLRVREKGSDAGNNGIKSLNAHLGERYHRLRVGVYNDLRDRVDDVDFVLGNFTKSEQEILDTSVIPKCLDVIDSFIADTLEPATHVSNQKSS